MTRQELFDKCVQGIIEQGVAGEHLGRCKYYQDTGEKCAVGILMSDEEAKEFESKYSGQSVNCAQLPEYLEEHRDLLFALQRCHDKASMCISFMKKFLELAKGLAGREGLNTDACLL